MVYRCINQHLSIKFETKNSIFSRGEQNICTHGTYCHPKFNSWVVKGLKNNFLPDKRHDL